MNKKVSLILSIGIISLMMYLLNLYYVFLKDNPLDIAQFLSMVLALFGMFFGLWYLLSLAFKEFKISAVDTTLLILSTLLNILVFLLFRYRIFLIFWIPSTVLIIVLLKVLHNLILKTSNVIVVPLRTKISALEKMIEEKSRMD